MVTWTVRIAVAEDESFLRNMQYEALFIPPGAEPFPRSIVDEPGIARYYVGFGTEPGDDGRIAETAAGTPIGAAWVRQVEGYGFVDDETPELGIAVVGDRRGDGVGTRLLASLLAATPRCSLSVDDRNPALQLYERMGFERVRRDGDHTLVMLRSRRP